MDNGHLGITWQFIQICAYGVERCVNCIQLAGYEITLYETNSEVNK